MTRIGNTELAAVLTGAGFHPVDIDCARSTLLVAEHGVLRVANGFAACLPRIQTTEDTVHSGFWH